MKARNNTGVFLALAVGLTLAHQAFADCSVGACTETSLTVCSDDNTDCHKGYWIGYRCSGEVTYKVTIHNGDDKDHTLRSSGPNEVTAKIWRWNLTKDAYVSEISCCEGSDCTTILDESSWRS